MTSKKKGQLKVPYPRATGIAVAFLLATHVVSTSDGSPRQTARRPQSGAAQLVREFTPLSTSFSLFDAGSDYVLVPTADSSGMLASVRIASKCTFREDCADKTRRPTMTASAYESILKRLGRVQPLGPIVHRGSAFFASAGVSSTIDEYEKAFIKRNIIPVRPEQVVSATVCYMKEVTGLIASKDNELFGFFVTVQGRENRTYYQVPSGVHEDLVIGRVVTFRGIRAPRCEDATPTP